MNFTGDKLSRRHVVHVKARSVRTWGNTRYRHPAVESEPESGFQVSLLFAKEEVVRAYLGAKQTSSPVGGAFVAEVFEANWTLLQMPFFVTDTTDRAIHLAKFSFIEVAAQ